MKKINPYAVLAKILDISPSSVEADSELKLLAEIYNDFINKKISKKEIGWKIAFPIANYPNLRKLFNVNV